MKSLIKPSAERYNLSPMRYPWAKEAWDLARPNFWTEQQANMGRDKASFESLSVDERETFLDVFATLTTSDLVVQENLLGNIAATITVPEISLFIAHQGADEALHSVVYQHVIEVLALGDDAIYKRYLEKPAIGQKFTLAKQYGAWIRGDDIISRYLGMVFYYAGFEGIWFYHGFTPILNLGRVSKMPGTCEQLQYIARDETTHFQFGVKLLNEMADEIGRGWIAEADVQGVFRALVDAEEIYARACIRPVLGYNAETHIEYTRWLCNLRLQQLGWAPCFPGARNVVPWLQEVLQIKKEKNFFETHPTEYQTGKKLEW
jgi:ribonucleoside-diphosphate reductase beta chain